MLWLITKYESYVIMGCNIHKEGDVFQVWVNRLDGKSRKIGESTVKEEAYEIREAIDYAITKKSTVFDLRS